MNESSIIISSSLASRSKIVVSTLSLREEMGLRKAKRKLSSIFRVAMRNAGKKPPDAASTAEAVAGESPEMDFIAQGTSFS